VNLVAPHTAHAHVAFVSHVARSLQTAVALAMHHGTRGMCSMSSSCKRNRQFCTFRDILLWRSQDLHEGGAKPFAGEACAKNLSHAPKLLTTPLVNAFLKIAG
jgi:hypothetical protein